MAEPARTEARTDARTGTPSAAWTVHSSALDPPVLDEDGLLRHRGAWVPISDSQIPLVEILVQNLGRLVPSSEIRRTYTAAGGSGSATSLRSVTHRLGRRVAAVGLRLHVVRGRGVILVAEAPGE